MARPRNRPAPPPPSAASLARLGLVVAPLPAHLDPDDAAALARGYALATATTPGACPR